MLTGLTIGVLAGAVVSLFRLLIQLGLGALIGVYQHITPGRVVVLVLGSLVVALAVAQLLRCAPDIAGSGIPQVEGQLQGTMDFPWWRILWTKFVAGVLSIGSGLFLGREGPSIQLGAAVGQGVAAKLHRTGANRRVLIAAGAAAGLSAAFNAPIAGAMFVLEEVYHNFSPLVWISSLASAIGADFVALNVFGLKPVLHLTYTNDLPPHLYWHLLALGIVLGLLGRLYQKVLLAMPALYAHTHIPRHYQGVVPFLLVIPIGVLTPQLLGGGNQLILSFGTRLPVFGVLVGILALRFMFSMVAYGSGLPGGIFLPILSLGAVIGAAYVVGMRDLGWLPAVYAPNLIIFAMAGYFAGIAKSPFTAILLITEMVGNLAHLLPLAVVALTAYLVVDLLNGAPIYAALLDRLTVATQLNQIHQLDRVEVPVFAGGQLEGRAVRDVAWPASALLIGITRGEKQVLPHGDTVLRAGDTLVVLTDAQQQAAVRALAGGED